MFHVCIKIEKLKFLIKTKILQSLKVCSSLQLLHSEILHKIEKEWLKAHDQQVNNNYTKTFYGSKYGHG